MTGVGSVLPGAAGVVVSIHAQGWGFTLRRADFQPAELFVKCHGKDIGPGDVARFLPDWRSLKWVGVPSSLLSRLELGAIDHGYHISLCADCGSDMQRDELIGAFLRFME